MSEMLLDVAQVAQPSPHRNPGGDCFACSLIATLSHLFPDREPPTFQDTDRWFMGETTTGTEVTNNTAFGMRDALRRAGEDGWETETLDELAHVPNFQDWRGEAAGFPWQEAGDHYAYRLEAWLAAGWVALTNVLYSGEGLFTPGLKMRAPDHFVVLDGARVFWKDKHAEDGSWSSASRESEVHVVCSAKGPYWIDTMTLERGHGALSWLLVRAEHR